MINFAPREPITDVTLGIAVPAGNAPAAAHRLVTVGDSLTQGFMSAAIRRTDLSWPAMVAYEMGLTPDQFRFPTYEGPTGPGGLPVDLERLARAFERRFGPKLDFWEAVSAGLWVRSYMDRIEDYWESGPGSLPPPTGDPFHNMAVTAGTSSTRPCSRRASWPRGSHPRPTTRSRNWSRTTGTAPASSC